MTKTFNIADRYDTLPVQLEVPVGFSIPLTWFAVADLDGDGYDELVVAGHNMNEDSPRRGAIFHVDDDGQLHEATDLIAHDAFPATVWPREIIFDDFNGDKRLDVFITATGWDYDPFPGEPNELLLSNSKGRLVAKSVPFEEGEFSHSAASGDIDGDGDKDIYVGNVGGQNIKPYLLINNGKGGFKIDRDRLPDSVYGSDDTQAYDTVAFVDVDSDGHQDLILGKFIHYPGYDHKSRVFYNDGKGRFTDDDVRLLPNPKPFGSDTIAYHIEPFDIDRDGDQDLLMVYTGDDHRGWAVQALMNDGTGDFTDRTGDVFKKAESSKVDVNYFMSFLRPFDLNNDGFMDLVPEYIGPENDANSPAFWLNDGTGHFSAILNKEFLHKDARFLSHRQIALNTPDGVVFALPFDLDDGRIINDAIGLKDDPVSTGPGGMNPATVGAAGFNELYYLDHTDGVAKAVRKGEFKTGLEHYLEKGAAKGFDAAAPGALVEVAEGSGAVALANGDIVAVGSGGHDEIAGSFGDNTISGGRGKDRLSGGKGNDELSGDGGNDILAGGKGNDRLEGGAGKDVLLGGKGKDALVGGKGKDTASYEDASKGMTASLAEPEINRRDAKGDSYASIENLTGSGKGDRLTGSGKANVLKGLAGNDRLDGGKGNDRLDGGAGKDVLTGGDGRDTFVFASVEESTVADKRWDFVTDFDATQKDRIHLKAIDARTDLDGNQAFAFIADAAFSGTAGELRVGKGDGQTFVYGDVDGDASADLAIKLDGSLDLKQADLVL